MEPTDTLASPTPPAESPASEGRAPRSLGARIVAIGWFTLRLTAALFAFVGALQVMKTGAASLDALNEGGLLVRNAASTFGLGWLGALLVLSGSPVAASALTLVAAGSIEQLQGYTMLVGSRVGAAFVVLLVAVIYALRGREGERMKPVSTAVMALSTTALVYVPGALIGYALFKWSAFRSLDLQLPTQFRDLIDIVYGPLLDLIETWPPLVLLAGGLGLLLLSFKLIDTVVPHLDETSITERHLGALRKKWPMFGLGCLVALVTMSVSVALTLLVPLVAKGYVKRDSILPYIMGANITTLGDTLLAAFLLDSAPAVRIVLAGIFGTTVVSLILLAFFYPQIRRGVWKFQRQVIKSKPRLAAFTAALFLVPLTIIAASGLLG